MHHDIVVKIGERFQKIVFGFVCRIDHSCRDIFFDNLNTVFAFIVNGFHFEDIDDTFKVVFFTDRQSDGNGFNAESVLHHLDDVFKVCAVDVHLVDERKTGDFIIVSLTPDCFRLRLNAAFCAEYRNGTVENSKASADFNGEVNVSGRIDYRDAVSRPSRSDSGGSDGDTALLLLLHVVHGSGTVVSFTYLVRLAGIEQDTLGSSRFARIDVGHNSYVSYFFEWESSVHLLPLTTICNVRMPYWLQPYDAFLPFS